MALPNYVKFQRGTLASYNRLSQKDNDTLYFIYDANDDTRGSLYLGNRLIGEVGGSGGASNLSELSDVLISAAQTGDFLTLNSQGKWINISASDLAQTILDIQGQFVEIDENEFQFNAVNGKLELKNYSAASVGMMPVKTNSGLSWQIAPSANLDARVGSLESDMTNVQTELQSVDSKIATKISQANHLKYKVISDLAQATEENTIYLYNSGSGSSGDLYEEYMLVNGSLEVIGSLAVDLSNYVTTTALENALNAKANQSALTALDTRVGALETTVSDLSSTISSLNTSISNLNTSVNSLESRVGTLENNANNYVTTTALNAVVGDLSLVNGVYNNLDADSTITDNLVEIYERLTWQEISE